MMFNQVIYEKDLSFREREKRGLMREAWGDIMEIIEYNKHVMPERIIHTVTTDDLRNIIKLLEDNGVPQNTMQRVKDDLCKRYSCAYNLIRRADRYQEKKKADQCKQ